jgi:hypothetical protein
VPRRASLPGADLLFGSPSDARHEANDEAPAGTAPARPDPAVEPAAPPAPRAAKVSPPPASVAAPNEQESGSPRPPARRSKPQERSRPRHEEKVTFYCTDSDLTRLEAARLSLRAHHKLSTDRGRIVRAAIAEILDDFDVRGADSALVKRLSDN